MAPVRVSSLRFKIGKVHATSMSGPTQDLEIVRSGLCLYFYVLCHGLSAVRVMMRPFCKCIGTCEFRWAQMESPEVLSVFRLTPLSQFLRDSCISAASQPKLVAATYNRAVLLTEIPKTVLLDHLAVDASDLEEVDRVCQQIIFACGSELQTRGRHLPVIFERVVGTSVHEQSAALRPTNWTWIELWSAGVREKFSCCVVLCVFCMVACCAALHCVVLCCTAVLCCVVLGRVVCVCVCM